MKKNTIESLACRKFTRGAWQEIQDPVSSEIRICINWKERRYYLWSFPRDLEDLVLGHAALDLCTQDEVPEHVSMDGTSFTLQPAAASKPAISPAHPWQMTPDTLLATMNTFLDRDGFFKTTGCFHRMSAYSPASGEILTFVEDIGRHNCVDRLAGWALRTAMPLHDLVLFCSSRVTGSLMHKISKAGFGAVISRSATTRAAINLALDRGITLVGFTRTTRFTVFCDPKNRIAF